MSPQRLLKIKSDNKDESHDVAAVEKPVQALGHTAIYKMHRYYARRPWNVFEHIIRH